MIFFFIYGVIHKIAHSLGSDRLIGVINKVCDESGSPASCLVKHGVLMWYGKTVQVDEIARMFSNENFSETCKKILRFMVVNHCSMHSLGYRDKQKISDKLKIPTQNLLPTHK
jgi:hypothetical protein